eukprot:scaffold222665_cov28-Tisochrysis_lutea.AAC.2
MSVIERSLSSRTRSRSMRSPVVSTLFTPANSRTITCRARLVVSCANAPAAPSDTATRGAGACDRCSPSAGCVRTGRVGGAGTHSASYARTCPRSESRKWSALAKCIDASQRKMSVCGGARASGYSRRER